MEHSHTITRDQRLTTFLTHPSVARALTDQSAVLTEDINDIRTALESWKVMLGAFDEQLGDLITDALQTIALEKSDDEPSEYSPERGFCTERVIGNLRKNILKIIRELGDQTESHERGEAWNNYCAVLRTAGREPEQPSDSRVVPLVTIEPA